MSRVPIGYSVRLGVVTRVFNTQVECQYTDREGEHSVRCPIPHPYAGQGGGIFIGVDKGTRVLLSMAPQEQAYIVAVVPERDYYFSQDGVLDTPVSVTPYPNLKSGEVCLKGPTGSRLDLDKKGNISFEAGAGELEADLEISSKTKALFFRANNILNFNEAGREVCGVVKRNVSEIENANETNLVNFLSGESYDSLLTDIGRHPKQEVSLRSNTFSTRTLERNPALVEKRSILYEYANSYGVKALPFEAKSMEPLSEENLTDTYSSISSDPAARENRRTDILNLNSRNYNHLIEKVEGTVVDIYGNILDINRNKISFPDNDQKIGEEEKLKRLHSYLRRSIKYHFEMNSRKEQTAVDLPINVTTTNAKEHSRWSMDIDAEGLTKINIPASSETGNIPVLGRYITSKNLEETRAGEGQFRDSELTDIRLLSFGKGTGQEVTNGSYLPDTANVLLPLSVVGTAHHDLSIIAPSIFSSGKLKNPVPAVGAEAVKPLSVEINNQISDFINGSYSQNKDANAGGRSLNLNLDGSAELSIGADTANRKSMLLDLAGGMIFHCGRDKNGRSIIHQTDGDVIIQIGGTGISDERFKETIDTENRPGRLEIHLNRPGGTSQKIVIDENGMTIDVLGNGIIKTSGDLTLSAGGKLLLDGESVYAYGSFDEDISGERKITGKERLVVRKGRII